MLACPRVAADLGSKIADPQWEEDSLKSGNWEKVDHPESLGYPQRPELHRHRAPTPGRGSQLAAHAETAVIQGILLHFMVTRTCMSRDDGSRFHLW